MGFEVFDKRHAALGKAPSVTIQKRGLFSINRAAHALIGSPGTIELLYDKDQQIVGLRPTADDTPHGYTVRPQSPTKDTGPVIVAGTAFTQYYDIDTSMSRRWTPSVDGGILCIDLKDPGTPIVGNRSRRTGQPDSDDA